MNRPPLTDTHCHIHETDYDDQSGALTRSHINGVRRLICVGTDAATTKQAVRFAEEHADSNVWASLGLHPHDAVKDGVHVVADFENLTKSPRVVAIGECGLDYFYEHSPREAQIEVLRAQLDLAQNVGLPVIFHVREAFDDFWPIFDSYQAGSIRGVVHSFTDNAQNLAKALDRGLYIGVNGIATFAKKHQVEDVYKTIPLDRLLLETDAPFLTPTPLRGRVNEPAFITHVARFMADLLQIPLLELSAATEENATHLFFTSHKNG